MPKGERPRKSRIVDIVLAVNWPPHAPARAGDRLEFVEVGVADLPGRVRADLLEHVADRDVAVAVEPGCDRAGVGDDRGDVEAADRHRGAGVRLVAGDEHDEPVEQMPSRDELDRVGDHLPRDERGAHPARSHRDPVRDRDRVELHRRAARVPDAPLDVDCARSRWLRLHGIVSIHVVPTPTIGFARSSSVKPAPFSIARAPARSGPSVRAALWRFAGSDGVSLMRRAAPCVAIGGQNPWLEAGRAAPRPRRARRPSRPDDDGRASGASQPADAGHGSSRSSRRSGASSTR